jgi:hypothetical protein
MSVKFNASSDAFGDDNPGAAQEMDDRFTTTCQNEWEFSIKEN